MTTMSLEMTGKALLFKSIGVQKRENRRDFHQVSDDLTLTQAAAMLNRAHSGSGESLVVTVHLFGIETNVSSFANQSTGFESQSKGYPDVLRGGYCIQLSGL